MLARHESVNSDRCEHENDLFIERMVESYLRLIGVVGTYVVDGDLVEGSQY